MLNIARTKIVATIGPACGTPEKMAELIRLGVDVFRLNMAHGSRQQHQEMVDAINQARSMTGIDVGILVDLAGPKIRLGDLYGDALELRVGDEVTFVKTERPESSHQLTCTYKPLVDELSVGDSIMLADGLLRLSVIDKSNDLARCVVVDGGILRGRQGVNVPGTHLSAPAMDDDDIGDPQCHRHHHPHRDQHRHPQVAPVSTSTSVPRSFSLLGSSATVGSASR